MSHRCAAAGLAALIVLLAGCGNDVQKRFGQRCGGDEECVTGLCVAGAGKDHPFCTKSCATGSECPRGYSCSGATGQGVVVCVRGAGTPFGQ